jgi:hypothetical protein
VVVCLVGVSSSAVALIKHSSATFFYIVSTLSLPLTNLAFAVPVLMNPPEHITGFTLIGLGVIVAGMLLYSRGNATEESQQNSTPSEPRMEKTPVECLEGVGAESVGPSRSARAADGRTTPMSLHDVSTVN